MSRRSLAADKVEAGWSYKMIGRERVDRRSRFQ